MSSSTLPEGMDQPGEEPAISLRNIVVVRRRRRILTLEHVDLGRGVTRVCGPNGAGKSTLLKVVSGLWRPRTGTVTVLGIDMARDARRIYGHMGYVSQQTLAPQSFTVHEVLAYSAWLKGMSARAGAHAGEQALARLALGDISEHPFGRLSGGLQRRVLFAAETIHEPDALLLDEPFSGVDQGSRLVLAHEVARLRAKGTAVVVVTHDENDATLLVPDRVLQLERGALLAADG